MEVQCFKVSRKDKGSVDLLGICLSCIVMFPLQNVFHYIELFSKVIGEST